MSDFGKAELSYLNSAKGVAKLSNHPKYKIGCVIVRGHRIISCGSNSNTKTEPIQAKLDSVHFNCECTGKVHAETDALLYFIKHHISLSGSTLYTYRERKDGNYGLARPCPRCMELIKLVGIRKIVYTTNHGIAKEKLEY